MSTPPRSLSFAVGTSLLTASLSLGAAACTDAKPKDDAKTDKSEPKTVEVKNVNTRAPDPEPPPQDTKVNPGPEPEQPPVVMVNPGPEPEQPPKPPEGAGGINVGPEPEPSK
jgi:hypothetical protein